MINKINLLQEAMPSRLGEAVVLSIVYKPTQRVKKIKKQRTKLQMKEQDITAEKNLNKMKMSNLPDKEFKLIVKMMLIELERMNDHSENFNKEREILRKDTFF